MITRDFFDVEQCTEDFTVLSSDGADEVDIWLEGLVDCGYEIRSHIDMFQAAAFLKGNGFADDQVVDEIAIILATALASANVDWEEIKECYID